MQRVDVTQEDVRDRVKLRQVSRPLKLAAKKTTNNRLSIFCLTTIWQYYITYYLSHLSCRCDEDTSIFTSIIVLLFYLLTANPHSCVAK